jgi:hypothetical protein
MSVVMEGCLGRDLETTSFTPRAPRLNLKIPVVFDFDRGRASGQSVNISESGILAVFDRSLDIWITGRLSILVGDSYVRIQARVARVNGRIAALAFRPMSGTDRTIIHNFIEE